MLPSFERLGRTITFYSIFSLVGIGLGITVAVLRCKRLGQDRMDLFFAALYGILGLLVGAKVLYLITIIPYFPQIVAAVRQDANFLLMLFTSGFVWYGGLLGFIGGVYIYCRQYKLHFLPMIDTMVVSVPLAHAFGRLGCLAEGCCYGCVYDGPGHIVFQESKIAPNGVPLFPSQPLEAICNLILFFVLLFYGRKTRPTGRITGIYLCAYAVIRFVLEFWRGDGERGLFLGISTSQLISILLLPIGLMLIFSNRFRRKEHEET